VVDGDILDLNLRISQPNVHDLRSDGTLTGFGLSCNSPEASSSIVSQVNIIQLYVYSLKSSDSNLAPLSRDARLSQKIPSWKAQFIWFKLC
jgi:hypothetical protein